MASSRELFILGLIARRPTHGYEIKQFLSDAVVESWTNISTTHIYHTLGKLKKQGFIEARVERFGNQPPRDVFSITPQGRQALAEMLGQDDLLNQKVFFDFHIILATIGGLRDMPDNEKTQLVKRRIAIVERTISERREKHAQGRTGRFADTPLVQALSRHEVDFARHELEWLLEVLGEIEQLGWSAFSGRSRRASAGQNHLVGTGSASNPPDA